MDPRPSRHTRSMMKISAALVVGIVLALPCHAATVTIGPSVGFDVYSSNGNSTVIVTAPDGSDALLGGLKPGLRVGVRDATGMNTVFTDVSLMAISSSGSTLHTFSGTINYAHAFHDGTSPYVTGGIGFANFGGDGYSETATMFGGGVGQRLVLGHGHGAVRLEARYDRATSNDFSVPLNILGLRVGFDLDLQ